MLARLYAVLFAIGLVVYGVAAWGRLGKQSGSPHFVFQADAWLTGAVAIEPPLPNDDWAVLETVELADGGLIQGRRMVTKKGVFRALDGTEYSTCLPGSQPKITTCAAKDSQIKHSRGWTHHVSFPAFPAVIMLPTALIGGRGGNDVIPTLLLAALILPMMLLVLRRLSEAELSKRTLREDLWLVVLLAFGSVMFVASIQGKVWYTAHVVGVLLALIYAWAAIEAKRPVVAGLALGAAALTRTSMAFMFPLFVFEVWRMAAKAHADEVPPNASASMNLRAGRKAVLLATRGPLIRFAIPVVAFAVLGMIYNQVRFSSLTEFGHSYLALGTHEPVVQQQNIEQWGLASTHYLSRNLAVALTSLPDLLPRSPWIQMSGHGLAIWFTTPALLLLLWPRDKGPLHRALWLTTLFVALPSLLYMNTGWFQFGYRFSLDYMVFMVMLLAVGGRPMGRVFKALIVAGVIVNLFGVYSYDREPQHYKGTATVVVN
ncbi:MAG: hypothetical protein H0V17_28710 [Deltaproteobacteria bacterium]|nr:hypothetical protein [Deltaproteobacteria bacterium]